MNKIILQLTEQLYDTITPDKKFIIFKDIFKKETGVELSNPFYYFYLSQICLAIIELYKNKDQESSSILVESSALEILKKDFTLKDICLWFIENLDFISEQQNSDDKPLKPYYGTIGAFGKEMTEAAKTFITKAFQDLDFSVSHDFAKRFFGTWYAICARIQEEGKLESYRGTKNTTLYQLYTDIVEDVHIAQAAIASEQTDKSHIQYFEDHYQEDRFFIFLDDNKDHSSQEERLFKTIKELAENHKNTLAGSTFCVATLHQNKITLANVGDSRAVLFIQDKKETTQIKTLNLTFDQEAGIDRFLPIVRLLRGPRKYMVSETRVYIRGEFSHFGIASAIGDLNLLGYQIDTISYTIPENILKDNNCYLVLISDGCIEANPSETLSSSFKSIKPEDNISQKIIQIAGDHGSQDNLTALTVLISGDQNLCLGVADGHGGGETSIDLVRNFQSIKSMTN